MSDDVVDRLQDAIGDVLDGVEDLARYIDVLCSLRVWLDATIDAAQRDLDKRPSKLDATNER